MSNNAIILVAGSQKNDLFGDLTSYLHKWSHVCADPYLLKKHTVRHLAGLAHCQRSPLDEGRTVAFLFYFYFILFFVAWSVPFALVSVSPRSQVISFNHLSPPVTSFHECRRSLYDTHPSIHPTPLNYFSLGSSGKPNINRT